MIDEHKAMLNKLAGNRQISKAEYTALFANNKKAKTVKKAKRRKKSRTVKSVKRVKKARRHAKPEECAREGKTWVRSYKVKAKA